MIQKKREYISATKHDVSRFYDTKAATYGKELFKESESVIDSYFPPLDNWETLLDAGCGTGGLMERAKALGKKTTGIDISRNMVEICISNGLYANVGDIKHIQFPDGSFDLVTCTGALEHTPNPNIGRDELCRLSRRYVSIILPLWYEDKEGPVSRHYLNETLPNIERWLLPEEWDAYFTNRDGIEVIKREIINQGRDIMYWLEKKK